MISNGAIRNMRSVVELGRTLRTFSFELRVIPIQTLNLLPETRKWFAGTTFAVFVQLGFGSIYFLCPKLYSRSQPPSCPPPISSPFSILSVLLIYSCLFIVQETVTLIGEPFFAMVNGQRQHLSPI